MRRKATLSSILILVTLLGPVFGLRQHRLFAAFPQVIDAKVLCDAILEDDFVDDAVIVVLDEQASQNFRQYTPKDFPEIGCENVKI